MRLVISINTFLVHDSQVRIIIVTEYVHDPLHDILYDPYTVNTSVNFLTKTIQAVEIPLERFNILILESKPIVFESYLIR